MKNTGFSSQFILFVIGCSPPLDISAVMNLWIKDYDDFSVQYCIPTQLHNHKKHTNINSSYKKLRHVGLG